MPFLWIATVKDLRRLGRDPFALGMWVGIPLVLAVMISVLFGPGSGAKGPQGRLLVADDDGTIASRLLMDSFRQEPLRSMVVVEQVTAAAGRERIERGEASAFLLISPGLQEAFLNQEPYRLQLVTNPSQSILPQIIEKSLATLVEGASRLQLVAGDTLRSLNINRDPGDPAIARTSIAIGQTVRKVLRYLDPPLIQVATNVIEQKARPNPNFAAVFLPNIIFMSLMMIANGLAIEVWKERLSGTLRRLAATPAPFASFLGSRLLVVAMVLTGVAAVGLGAMRVLVGMRAANFTGAALWMVAAGGTLYLLVLLAVLYTSSFRAANVVGNMVIFPLSMIGGCFFPFEAMPEWMARIGRYTPNGWALVQFKALVDGSANWAGLAAGAAGFLVLGGLAFTLAVRRLRRGFLI